MPISIEDIISAHYYEFFELAISPDDCKILAVFGNSDMPHDRYSIDVMNRSIWSLELSGGKAVELCPRENDAHSPKWSRDGKSIAYFSRCSGKTELWTMSSDGSGKRQLTRSEFTAENPFDRSTMAWSPDGGKIAYSVAPNGSRYTLAIKEPEGFHVLSAISDEERKRRWTNPDGLRGEVHLIDIESGQIEELASEEGDAFSIIGWSPDGERLLVRVGADIRVIDITSGNLATLYSGSLGLSSWDGNQLRIARTCAEQIEIGTVADGNFEVKRSISVGPHRVSIDVWSPHGFIYGRAFEGVSIFLCEINTLNGEYRRVTQRGWVVPGAPICLNRRNSVVFPYESPRTPVDLWIKEPGCKARRISKVNDARLSEDIPEVRIVSYPSGGWSIEALLVLPLDYEVGVRYPTLIYLHGGPERSVNASFRELISARADSAAHYLATKGYVVLLPNFRGSSGYGSDFLNEISGYRIMETPFQDLMNGANYLVDVGIADPNRLGIYGTSFGAWLAAWAAGQTRRFKGAVAAIGAYDILGRDRLGGTPFCALRPNRLGDADPKALWTTPEIYKRISPIENTASIETPMLLIETGAEQRNHQTLPFWNRLCDLGIESYLVRYPLAYHGGGWNDEYKQDYVIRLHAWFDHCLLGAELPESFLESP